jgi:hypothetical protein
MVNLLSFRNRKRGGLFVVEGAITPPVGSALFELQKIREDLDYIRSLLDLFDEMFGKIVAHPENIVFLQSDVNEAKTIDFYNKKL